MIGVISSLEILIVNLIINELATTKKIKKLYHYLIIVLHTVIVFTVYLVVIPEDTPTFLAMLIAWTYLIPFLFIYKEKVMIIIITMSFALTHSIFVNGLAYHILVINSGTNQSWNFVILQTLIFTVSTPLMVFFINKRIKYIIKALNDRIIRTILLISLASFLTVFTLRFFIEIQNIPILILTYLSIFILLFYSYFLAYTIIHTKKNLDQLNTLVYEDSLTKIKNRLALYRDFDAVLENDVECYLYFMDLDKLKNINDTYGHITGDQYIVAFTNAVNHCLNSEMDFYRISGDEFIILDSSQLKNNLSIEKINNSINDNFNFRIQFQGVSIGKSSFPNESNNLDSLLSLADKRMYIEKNKKA